MLRREVIKLGGLFGLGAGTPSRFPYPGRPQPSPGVSPSQGQVVRAQLVIVKGPAGGVFVYDSATGKLIGAISDAAADPVNGTPIIPVITAYSTTGGSYVSLQPGTAGGGNAALAIGSGDSAEAVPLKVLTQVAGAGATRRIATTVRAPRVSGEAAGTACSLLLESPSADLSIGVLASVTVSDDGVNFCTLNMSQASLALANPTIVQLASGATLLNVTPAGVTAQNTPFTSTAGTTAAPTLVTTDSWQAISTFFNGWSATPGGLCRCRLMPDGMVYVYADVTAGTLANGTNMFQLPSSSIYNPVQLTAVPVIDATAVALTGSPYCNVTTSRVFQAQNFTAGTTRIVVNASYPSGAQLP